MFLLVFCPGMRGEHRAWSPFSLLKIYWVSQMMFIIDTQTLMNGLLNI